MESVLNMIVGACLIVVGYTLCELSRIQKKDDNEIVIRRTKTSMRNPLRTYEIEYDKYKGKNGLYEPQVPKRGE